MDASGVIDRSDGVEPFLLVDTHVLQLSVEFLWYINDVSCPWRVCIGLPYGTHKWRLADSEQLNRELSRLFTIGKEDLL